VGQWHAAVWSDTWLVLVLPWLAALGWECVATRRPRLRVERTTPEPLRLGRRDQCAITWHNDGDRSLQLEWEAPVPEGFAPLRERRVTTIAAGDRSTDSFLVEPRELGTSHWPPLGTQIRGPAGLAWWRHAPDAALATTVAPDTLAGHAAQGGRGRSGQRTSHEQGAGSEFLGLRDYRTGDPLRNVDWKATARHGKPVVKRFGQDQQLELVIAVDAGRRSQLAAGSLTRFGHYVNVAAQLAERCLHNGDRAATLVFADRVLGELPPGHGSRHVMRLRSLLGQTHSQPQESNPLVAALGVRRLLSHRGLVVLLTDTAETEATGQLAQATRLLASQHLPLLGTLIDPEQRAMTRASPTSWMAPYYRLAALELERQHRLTGRQLQRLGAHVARAEPGDLANRLLDSYEQLRLRQAV
jgi:uncharacterized protein (DUF58 family)